jgi:seryl-tRNA synthetase
MKIYTPSFRRKPESRTSKYWAPAFAGGTTLLLLVNVSLLAVTKDSYLKKADKELQSWSAKVDRLQKKAEKAGARTREELDRDIPVIRQKLEEVRKDLTKLRGSGQSSWKSLRRGAEDALRDAKNTYQNATKLFYKNENKQEEP